MVQLQYLELHQSERIFINNQDINQITKNIPMQNNKFVQEIVTYTCSFLPWIKVDSSELKKHLKYILSH